MSCFVQIKHSLTNGRVYLLEESVSSIQDLDKLMTNISQLIQYGDSCQIISTPIKLIFKELLSFGSIAFRWDQNV